MSSTNYAQIRSQIREAVLVLHEKAHDLRGDHKLYIKEEGLHRDWIDRSTITLAVEKTPGGGFNLTWRTYLTAKVNINKNATTRRINKGRSNSYNRKTLQAHTRPWERDKTMEFEERAAALRTELKCLNSASDYIRRAELAATNFDPELEEEH